MGKWGGVWAEFGVGTVLFCPGAFLWLGVGVGGAARGAGEICFGIFEFIRGDLLNHTSSCSTHPKLISQVQK